MRMVSGGRSGRVVGCWSRGGAAIAVLIVALGLVVVGGVGGAYMLTRGSGGSTGAVELHEVERRTFEIVLTASGDLQARKQTVLRSELERQSMIVEIVDEGSVVQEGDVLVRLSRDEIQSDLDSQLLALESARSDLVSAENAAAIQASDNESSLSQAELKVELADLELEKWLEGDDHEKRKQLALDIDSAMREVDRLSDKYERSIELHSRDFLSSDELKRDELAKIKAESDLERAQIRSEVYEEYERRMNLKQLRSDVEEARAELERVKFRNESQLASKQADVVNRRRQLARREEQVSRLESQLEKTEIRAPTSGLVVYSTSVRESWRSDDGPWEVGSQVRPNEDIIVLPNNEEMVASIKIHESLVGQVETGQRARVRIDAAQGRLFEGVVDSVGVIAQSGGWRDPNLREYEVRVLLDASGKAHGLKPSMRCEGELVVGRVEDVLAVPLQAVFFDGPTPYVYSSGETGVVRRVGVRPGRRSSTMVEIAGGLSSGDRVLLVEPASGSVAGDEIDTSALAEVAEGVDGGGVADGLTSASAAGRSGGAGV